MQQDLRIQRRQERSHGSIDHDAVSEDLGKRGNAMRVPLQIKVIDRMRHSEEHREEKADKRRLRSLRRQEQSGVAYMRQSDRKIQDLSDQVQQ